MTHSPALLLAIDAMLAPAGRRARPRPAEPAASARFGDVASVRHVFPPRADDSLAHETGGRGGSIRRRLWGLA